MSCVLVCWPVCLPVCWSVYLSTSLSVCLSVCLLVCLSVALCPFVFTLYWDGCVRNGFNHDWNKNKAVLRRGGMFFLESSCSITSLLCSVHEMTDMLVVQGTLVLPCNPICTLSSSGHNHPVVVKSKTQALSRYLNQKWLGCQSLYHVI